MAVTITRTPRIDDDGTGTTGTVLNNAEKTTLYNEIDTALAKVAQLAGGNSFTGNQAIAGLLTIQSLGIHTFGGTGVGSAQIVVQNGTAGTGNYAQLVAASDTAHGVLAAWSSTISSGPFNQPGGVTLSADGPGGLSLLGAHASGALRCYTNSVERLRIAATGEIGINVVPITAAQLYVATDGGAKTAGIYQQNLGTGNVLVFMRMANSAGGVAGDIAQNGATGVAYGTTSDARLKDDAGRATDVAALRAVVIHDFTWKADGSRDRGVFAQEIHDRYPRAVLPGTDETTDDGSLAHPWMTDYSKFVPDLIVGWQQHDAALAELRALLARVKG